MKEKFEDPVGQPFVMPEQLLESLSECAPEGCILFYVDNMGQPQVHAAFLQPITEMGLRAYATKFLQGINNAEEEQISKAIIEDAEEGEDNSALE